MRNLGSSSKLSRILAALCVVGEIACVDAERDVEDRWLVVVGSPGTSLDLTTSAGDDSGESTGASATTTTGSGGGNESSDSTGSCTDDDLMDLEIGEADYPQEGGSCDGGDAGGDAGGSTGGGTSASTSTSTGDGGSGDDGGDDSGGDDSGGEESGDETGVQCADDPPPLDIGTRPSDPKSGVFVNNGTNETIVVTVTLSHPCAKGKTISLLEVPKNKTVHIVVGNDLDADGWTVTIEKGGKVIKPVEGKKKVKWKVGDTAKEGEIKSKTVTFE